jgi:hypothetical protein
MNTGFAAYGLIASANPVTLTVGHIYRPSLPPSRHGRPIILNAVSLTGLPATPNTVVESVIGLVQEHLRG